MKWRIPILAAFIAAGVATAATPIQAQNDKQPIVIGAAIAQSGFAAPYDTDPARAAEIAIAEVNAKGGVLGRPLKMVFRDTKSDVAQGAVAALEVIDEGAKAVVVTGDYDFGGAAARAANSRKIIAIAPFAADPKFGVEGIGPYAFTFATASDTVGVVLAEFAHSRGWKTAYMLVQTDIRYDQSVAASFRKRFTELGGKVLGRDVFAMDNQNIAAQITRLKSLDQKPDLIMLSTFAPAGPSALRQIRAADLNVPVLSGEDMDGDYWLKTVPNLGNFYFATMGSVFGDDPRPKVNEFIATFKKKYGHHPATGHTLTGYSMIQALSRAMTRAESTDPTAVKAELEKFKNEPLLVGPTSFSPKLHINFNRPMVVMQVQKGKHSFVELHKPQKVPGPGSK
jgi:branched-chain amino acid transport system substrate-binding protein